eukprot:SAG31_NODE_1259_length_9077_cov_3.520049_7_plen_274_part_00
MQQCRLGAPTVIVQLDHDWFPRVAPAATTRVTSFAPKSFGSGDFIFGLPPPSVFSNPPRSKEIDQEMPKGSALRARDDVLMSEQEGVLNLMRPALRVLDVQSCTMEELGEQYEVLRKQYENAPSDATERALEAVKRLLEFSYESTQIVSDQLLLLAHSNSLKQQQRDDLMIKAKSGVDSAKIPRSSDDNPSNWSHTTYTGGSRKRALNGVSVADYVAKIRQQEKELAQLKQALRNSSDTRLSKAERKRRAAAAKKTGKPSPNLHLQIKPSPSP